MRGLPYIARLGYGLATPRHSVAGMEVAGRVEAVGQERHSVSDWRRSVRLVQRRVRRVRLSVRKRAGRQAGQHHVGASRRLPHLRLRRPQALRDTGRIRQGHKVLIIGASGGVGTFAVQIAKSYGAEVTGVCSAKNVEMVRSIGADHVIDYAHEDFADGQRRYDMILDTAGNRSLSHLRRALTPQGTLVLVGGSGGPWLMGTERTLRALMLSPFVSQRLCGFLSQPKKEDLAVLKTLIEAGTVTPVIDRTYPLSEVPEAMRYLEERHPGGKVVIAIAAGA